MDKTGKVPLSVPGVMKDVRCFERIDCIIIFFEERSDRYFDHLIDLAVEMIVSVLLYKANNGKYCFGEEGQIITGEGSQEVHVKGAEPHFFP